MTARPPELDAVTTMLAESAAALSMDIDAIDWDRGFDPDLFFLPEHRASLYGTRLWDRLTREQRIALTRYQSASMYTVGAWVETVFGQTLLRRVYDVDPRSSQARHLYTEVAEECRHSTMFGRVIAAIGGSDYRPARWLRRLGKLPGVWAPPLLVLGLTLCVEEYFDALQREIELDPALQPLVRQISRVHVVEEARHLTFARAELTALLPNSPVERVLLGFAYGPVLFVLTRSFVAPAVYADAGLDARAAAAIARGNPHWRDTQRWGYERAMRTLDRVGVRNAFGDAWCRLAGAL
ncbi:AurF N-oxygenase family protein [Nocardia sp. NPDC003482]